MGIPLRVLIIEDVEDDAELLVQELRSKGYDPLFERVDTQKAMLEALDRQTWDIVICDYSMPGFDAISALKLMHKAHHDLPIILVSGTIGEEVAVEAMKAGAHDYIMKDNLSRFVPAIKRELAEYKERCRARKVEDQFRKLHRAIEHSPGTVIITDTEGKIEYVNPGFSDITGYTAEEVIGENPRIMNSGKQSQGFYKELWDTIKSGKEWKGEFCNRKKNGELYWESGSISPVKDEKGVITNYVAVKEDITGRRQMEDAIQTLVKSTVGVTGQEFFDRIVSNMCAWLGTEYAFIGNIEDGKTVRAFAMQLDRRIIYDYSYTISGGPCEAAAKDGYYSYTDGVCKLYPNSKVLSDLKAEGYVGVSLKDESRKVIGILWTASRHKLNIPPRTADVMEIIAAKASAEIERVQAEEELRKSEERFRELAENIPEVFWITSPDFNRMIYISPAYETTWGRTCKSLYERPKSRMDNIHPADRDRVTAALEDHIQGKADFEEEYRIIRPDGSERWIIDRAYSIKKKSGLTDHLIGVAKDITARKKAEEQVKKSLREKEVLLKEIHHRVKNNMQIVSSLLNLQAESVDDENLRQMLKKSQSRIKSMALVHEKLYQTEDLSTIDFSEYTRSLTARLLRSFVDDNTNRVQLRIDMDEVYLDVNKAIPCGLIINEIVTNSIKHAFPDSTTDVDKNKFQGKGIIKISMRTISASGSTEPEAEIVKLVISDNGIGLPEGLDFRNTKTLGMELINTLVDQLDGSIEYVNKGGTEFKITFGV